MCLENVKLIARLPGEVKGKPGPAGPFEERSAVRVRSGKTML